jgi:UDP-glucose 4-epimerase
MILVTGGAGFIGSYLVEYLRGQGKQVVVYDDLSNSEKPAGDFVLGDILDKEKLMELKPKQIYHLAANISVPYSIQHSEDVMKINGEGTKNVVELAKRENAAFMLFSSAAVYGDYDRPVKETDKLKPLSPYGESKVKAEEYAGAYSRATIVRPFNVYGKGQSKEYAGVITAFKNAEKLIVYGGEQVRDFVYVEDVIKAATLLMGKGGVWNIGSGVGTTINKLADLFGKLRQVKDYRPGDIRYSVANVSKLRSLGWDAVSIKKGLRKMNAL